MSLDVSGSAVGMECDRLDPLVVHFRYKDLSETTFIDRGLPHPLVYRPTPELVTPGFPRPDQVGAIFG